MLAKSTFSPRLRIEHRLQHGKKVRSEEQTIPGLGSLKGAMKNTIVKRILTMGARKQELIATAWGCLVNLGACDLKKRAVKT